MAQSKYNAINLDIGHYTAGTSSDPIPFVKKNHDRITSMHLKDRKYETNGGQNMPWGQGQTPLKEVLQLMKKEKYRFPGTIELEYTPPEGSDSMKEIALDRNERRALSHGSAQRSFPAAGSRGPGRPAAMAACGDGTAGGPDWNAVDRIRGPLPAMAGRAD
ncbi:MAG: TIM barrel protein [Acidobacteriia bacterium]|nr:TIM barrel protein [Terriglobia bacterium]